MSAISKGECMATSWCCSRRVLLPVLALLFLSLTALAAGQDLEGRVTEETLENGLRVILVEDATAPVIAFNLAFGVGGVDEPQGLGGIAHMVEHMAFKGTPTIGSADPEAEARALARVEVEALALRWAQREGSPEQVARARERFQAALELSQSLAHPAPIDELLSEAGAVGLNASTGYDITRYTVELPANRLELYARVYADVLMNTTFRYFYEERDVVRQERRQRNEDDPQGYLFEAFVQRAFDRHPYGRSLVGPAETIENYLATEAKAFYEEFYGPEDAVLVLVGDVDPTRDLPILERYFGAIPRGDERLGLLPDEPRQSEERRFTVRYDAQPQLVMGWHKPTYPDRSAFALDLVSALLTQGRTSRLYQRAVLEEGTALNVVTSAAYPGIRYSNLFLFYGQPRAPHGPEELEAAVLEELDRLASEPVSDEELDKVKNQVRANTVRSLASNSGLASSLAFHELFAGGWQRLFEDLEVYDSITPEEIMEVSREIFVPRNRTVGVLLPEAEEAEGEQ